MTEAERMSIRLAAFDALASEWEADAPDMQEELPEGEVLAHCAAQIRMILEAGA